jgi:hypothetical protein
MVPTTAPTNSPASAPIAASLPPPAAAPIAAPPAAPAAPPIKVPESAFGPKALQAFLIASSGVAYLRTRCNAGRSLVFFHIDLRYHDGLSKTGRR